jgi:hypothetical protein
MKFFKRSAGKFFRIILFYFLKMSQSFGGGDGGASSSNNNGGQNGGASASYGVLISNLEKIAADHYVRLLDTPRQQLVWLLKELTRAKVNQFDKLLLQMLRNIISGL